MGTSQSSTGMSGSGSAGLAGGFGLAGAMAVASASAAVDLGRRGAQQRVSREGEEIQKPKETRSSSS